jgi:hypothetical protein
MAETLKIEMTMEEANALTSAMGQVDTDELDKEDRAPLRWVMNRIGQAWMQEANRRAHENDAAAGD